MKKILWINKIDCSLFIKIKNLEHVSSESCDRGKYFGFNILYNN